MNTKINADEENQNRNIAAYIQQTGSTDEDRQRDHRLLVANAKIATSNHATQYHLQRRWTSNRV
jgi:hypothetical protein